MTDSKPILSVKNLTLAFSDDGPPAVEGITFDLSEGEALGIVGESGSGKSLTSLAVMGLLPKQAIIRSGNIELNTGEESLELTETNEEDQQKLRGKAVAMVFQEPMTSLNPSHTCGRQVQEAIENHTELSGSEAKKRVIELFEDVLLPRPEEIYDSYPHQISGGQKQRVMIAMALSCDPKVIIADEPTTALDVTVQKQVLEILKNLCQKNNTALIFITHDLGVVADIASRVMVMYRGKVLESGPTDQIFHNPSEPYTKALIECRPRLDKNPKRLPVVADFLNQTEPKQDSERHFEEASREVLMSIQNLNVWYPKERNWLGKPKSYLKAVDDVSLEVFKGETLGLVGESGCGKSTLGKTLVRLLDPQSGQILFKGQDIAQLDERRIKPLRRSMQLIFQDPYASLNPRFTVEQTLTEPMVVHGVGSNRSERKQLISDTLDKVGLPQESLSKYPHQFSGGQRQRICIARALVLRPEFIVCDESVSALDVSVQAMVLNLLNDLKDELDLTYIFVSHDLSVVKYMSDRIAVMRSGKILELGSGEEVYKNPKTEYTKTLIASIPQV